MSIKKKKRTPIETIKEILFDFLKINFKTLTIMNIHRIEIPKGKNNWSNVIIPILYEYKDKIGNIANRKG